MSSQLSSSDRLGYDPAALWKHFTPQIRTGGDLLPADSFNHPNLKARPDNITDSLADLCMDIQIGKACAGLNYKYRASGAEVRRAFKVRDFPPQVMESLHWGVPSMREEQVGAHDRHLRAVDQRTCSRISPRLWGRGLRLRRLPERMGVQPRKSTKAT